MNRLYSKRVSRPLGIHDFIEKVDNKKMIVFRPSVREEDNSVVELPVDQFSGQPFMLNSNGFITNDIMMFEECQSDSVARAIINRLKILHPESVDQRLSVDQIMNMVIPSNYGSPAEFVSAHKMMAEKAYKLYESDCKAYQDMMAAKAADVAKANADSLNGSVPNPE